MNLNNQWRSDEKSKPLDFDFFGTYLPSGKDGFTYMDVDGMIRWHGSNFNTDYLGYFILQERKTYSIWKNKTLKDIPFHEKIKYAILDYALTNAWKERYKGIYLIWTNRENIEESYEFQINGIDVTKEELTQFYWAQCFDRFPRYVFDPFNL